MTFLPTYSLLLHRFYAISAATSSTPIIALPATAYRSKKARIPNVVETKITDYPKIQTAVLRNRERTAAGLPKVTMLQRDKYVGPRTVFMDRLLASQESTSKCVHETYYKNIESMKDSPLPGIPKELVEGIPDMVKHVLSLNMATRGDLFNARKETIIRDLQAHQTDTGSPEVIVGIMTNKAIQLTEHLKANRHDFHAQKILIQTIQRRRRMLSYLKRQSLDRYFSLMKKLGIVHTDLV